MGANRRHSSCKFSSFQTVLASSTLLLASFPAAAQQLSVTGNTVDVAAEGGFAETLTIGSNGIVSDLTGVPTAGTLEVPSFSFTLEQNGVSDGSYTFAAGFVLDDQGSGRRLEIHIPQVSMNFSSGALSGSVAAAQDVTVLGRTADSSTQVTTTVNNNFASFNGSALSFNADNQLDLITNAGGIFADVIDTIDAIDSGNYSYAVFLKQTGGPANIQFGTGATGSFTQFPCTDGSAFELDSPASLPSIYAGAEGLQGQLKFAGSSGTLDASGPDLFSASTCATFIPPTTGGGGGGGEQPPVVVTPDPEEEVETANDDLIDELDNLDLPSDGAISDDLVDDINTALGNSSDLVDSVVTNLGTGDVSASAAVDVINTLNASLDLAGSAIQSDAAIDLGNVVDIVSGIGQVIDSLDNDGALSATLLTTVETSTISTLNEVDNLVTDTTSLDSAAQIVSATEQVINNFVGVGGALGEDLIASAQTFSESTLQSTLDDIAATLSLDVEFTDTASTQTLLSANSTLLAEVLEVTAISLQSTVQLADDAQSTIQGQGVSDAGASNLVEDLAEFVIPTGVTIQQGGESVSAVDLVSSVTGASSTSVDSETGAVSVQTDNGAVSLLVSDIAIVPTSVPEGDFTQPDGTVVSISDGVAITLAPSPADPVEFVSAIEEVGGGNFTTDIQPNGAIELTDVNSGDIFAATFSFDGATTGDAAASTSFTAPTGDPASSDFAFTVTFTDGSTQSIQPIVAETSFFDSVADFGFDIETDRSTGIITIADFQFRPDYFVTPVSGLDLFFRLSNQDANGVAYRATDANGDGITDYEVISEKGIQVVYGIE